MWNNKHQNEIPSLASKTSSYISDSHVFLTMGISKLLRGMPIICESNIVRMNNDVGQTPLRYRETRRQYVVGIFS